MSIFFDFEVGPRGWRFRRAVDGDKDDIVLLVDDELNKVFGEVNIGSLIELSTLSICMINEQKEVVGFMALSDYPNIPSVDPADWEVWIRNMFQRYYLSRNTLFIHYICCVDDVLEFFLEEAIVSVFDNDMYLKQLVLIMPYGCPEEIILKHSAMKKRNVYKHFVKRFEESTQFLYAFVRQEFLPKLRMRRAVEEDNDDIVHILHDKCPRLTDLYGEYYISELIGSHPESKRKIIVTEYQDRVVGVMCLNSDVNYEKLNATYDLQPYYGLFKAKALEKERRKRTNNLLKQFGNPIMLGEWSPFENIRKLNSFESEDDPKRDSTEVATNKKQDKVNFGRQELQNGAGHHRDGESHPSEDYTEMVYLDTPRQSQLQNLVSMSDLLDEDPFDYEIVNIDHRLLTIPEVAPITSSSKINFAVYQEFDKKKKVKRDRNSIYQLVRNTQENYAVLPCKGDPNAFLIEIIGVQEDLHERYIFHLLEAAFEIMKEFDYCIIEVPCTNKTFPLLQHFCFVPTKPAVCSNHALYIAHRASVLGKLRVREVELMDIPQVAMLLQDLEAKDTLWTIENSIQNREQYKAYVLQSGITIVGVGILEAPEQTDFIRSKYNLDMYHIHEYHLKGCGITGGFSTLKVAQAYSVFAVHFRFFVREMMRLSNATSLMWLTAYRNKWIAHKANALASSMLPLVPRKLELDCAFIPELRYVTELSKQITAFSTWFMSKKLTTVPKMDINTRIVVVGASRTAMAFLNSLLFSDASIYLTFTSVTLVSTTGLPYIRHTNPIAEMMLPKNRTSSDKYLKSVPYTYYVNIVQGTMVEVDNNKKYIRLANGGKYYYDLLFLLCGQQYQHPNYLKDIYEREENLRKGSIPPYIRLDDPQHVISKVKIETEEIPENVFIVNSLLIANKAVNYLKNMPQWRWRDNNDLVLVYGASIHAYCCLSALLEMNINVKKIIFIEPFPPEDQDKTRVPVFCNANVDKTVNEMMSSLQITVYRSFYFQSWTVDDTDRVTHVTFLSNFEMIKLPCFAFFYYGRRGISAYTLNAIAKSGIVYDGGILIDHKFRTKDPFVYAAGPATRYCRRYFADSYRPKYYDSYEVGEKLGTQIRNELDPLFCEDKKQTKRKSSVRFSMMTTFFDVDSQGELRTDIRFDSEARIPELKKPIMIHCTLPGNLQYLEVRPPGLKLPNMYLQTLHYNGHVLETFKGGYFKLHMTEDFIVDGITCLTRDKLSLENFKNIYGLPSTVLNNVHLRYTMNILDNFYDFFRSPWAYFLYHEECNELFAMAKELRPKGQKNGDTISEALRAVGNKLKKEESRFSLKMKVRSSVDHSAHVESITDYVMQWISENDVLLPMYYHPKRMIDFSHDISTNPAFRKKKSSLVMMLKKIL